MAKLRDFKSLIYRQNTVNLNSLTALKPVLAKRFPFNLDELKLVDCKISSGLITTLMESLTERS